MLTKKHIYFILIALCFLLYANSLNNAFVSDDIAAILKNPALSHPLRFGLEPAGLLNSFNYLIAGSHPLGYHLTSIILHSLNTILVFFFLSLFFKSESSLLGACLFAVHPIHAEAVAWVSGKPYIITSLFILVVYLLYHRDAAAISSGKKINLKRYLISLFIFSYYLFANLSFYFIFPLFLILADITFGRWRKAWKLWLPFLVIAILRLLLAGNLILQRISSVAQEAGMGVTRTNPIFNFAYSFFAHTGLLLWPGRLTLYHEPAVISSFALKAELFFLSLLLISLPFIFKRAKELFFGIGIFVLFLAPTYSPLMVSWLVAERYLYFPSLALSIFFAFFYERVLKNSSLTRILTNPCLTGRQEKPNSHEFIRLCILFIIAALGVRTVARNEDWKTPQRFWRQTALVSVNSPRAHNNMGDVYAQEGNTDAAIREFRRAIELKADYADAYHNLANTYYRKGDLKEAARLYQQAISFNPKLLDSYYNLGIIYLHTGELDLARLQFEKALALRPEEANARAALDLVRKKQAGE